MNGKSLSRHFTVVVGLVVIALNFGFLDEGFANATLGQASVTLPQAEAFCKANPEKSKTLSQCVREFIGLSGGSTSGDKCSTYETDLKTASEKYTESCVILGSASKCEKKAKTCSEARDDQELSADDPDADCDDFVSSSCPELNAMGLSDLREEASDLKSDRETKNSNFETLQDSVLDSQQEQMQSMQAAQSLQTQTRAAQAAKIEELKNTFEKLKSDKVGRIQQLRAQFFEIDNEFIKLREELDGGLATFLSNKNKIYATCEAKVQEARKAQEAKQKGKRNRGSQTRLGYSKQQRTKEDQAEYTKCLRSVASRSAFDELEKAQKALVSRLEMKRIQLDNKRAILTTNLAEVERLAEAAIQRASEATQAAIDSMEQQLKEQQQQAAQAMQFAQQKAMNLQQRMTKAQADFDESDREYALSQKKLKCTRASSRGTASSGTDFNKSIGELLSSQDAKKRACENLSAGGCTVPSSCGTASPAPASVGVPAAPAPGVSR